MLIDSNFNVWGLTIVLTKPLIARITINSDNSTIEIPYYWVKDKMIGVVPDDAPGRWATLRRKRCVFVAQPVKNWW